MVATSPASRLQGPPQPTPLPQTPQGPPEITQKPNEATKIHNLNDIKTVLDVAHPLEGCTLQVIFFYTTWCESSKNLITPYDKFTLEFPKLLFYKIDCDSVIGDVRSLGTLFFFKIQIKILMRNCL